MAIHGIRIAEIRVRLPVSPHKNIIMPTEKRKLGDVGEGIAVSYLEKTGYKILDKNYRKPWGEIDIIARKGRNNLVFIEVKTIKRFGGYFPEGNVNFKKQRKVIRTARTYLIEKRYPPKTIWQIDVIAVELNEQTRKADLKHIKNAIWR